MRWICIFICASLLSNQDPTHLAVTESYPSFLIDGCVSAITGDYYYACDDIVVRGAEPIRIPRIYLSSRHLSSRGGWSNLDHLQARIDGIHYETTEPNGTKLDYRQTPVDGKCLITEYSKALTNCGRGEISARHDLANQYIVPNSSGDHFRIFAADGTVRVFKKYSFDHNEGSAMVSKPAELPRWLLAERYVNLSIHTAPIRQTHPSSLTSSVQIAVSVC